MLQNVRADQKYALKAAQCPGIVEHKMWCLGRAEHLSGPHTNSMAKQDNYTRILYSCRAQIPYPLINLTQTTNNILMSRLTQSINN